LTVDCVENKPEQHINVCLSACRRTRRVLSFFIGFNEGLDDEEILAEWCIRVPVWFFRGVLPRKNSTGTRIRSAVMFEGTSKPERKSAV